MSLARLNRSGSSQNVLQLASLQPAQPRTGIRSARLIYLLRRTTLLTGHGTTVLYNTVQIWRQGVISPCGGLIDEPPHNPCLAPRFAGKPHASS